MNRELTEVTTNLNSKEIKVLDEIAKEKGMSRDTILRQSLRIYQIVETLSKKGNPKLQTLGALFSGLGFHLTIEPIRAG